MKPSHCSLLQLGQREQARPAQPRLGGRQQVGRGPPLRRQGRARGGRVPGHVHARGRGDPRALGRRGPPEGRLRGPDRVRRPGAVPAEVGRVGVGRGPGRGRHGRREPQGRAHLRVQRRDGRPGQRDPGRQDEPLAQGVLHPAGRQGGALRHVQRAGHGQRRRRRRRRPAAGEGGGGGGGVRYYNDADPVSAIVPSAQVSHR